MFAHYDDIQGTASIGEDAYNKNNALITENQIKEKSKFALENLNKHDKLICNTSTAATLEKHTIKQCNKKTKKRI